MVAALAGREGKRGGAERTQGGGEGGRIGDSRERMGL